MQICFSGKTALVTGAGSGIGEAIALELGRAGARVIVADLHPDTADAVADRIVAAGGQALPGARDVSDPALVAAHPVGRLGQPAEVAALTLFLLSDQAKFINGSYHLIDGGYCAQ